jgi:hypothetical protein
MLVRSVLFCFLLLSLAAQAEVYKWVDANGKTHFGDKVPESTRVETLNLPSAPSSRTHQSDVSSQEMKERQKKLLTTLTEERAIKQTAAKKNAEKHAALAQECAERRDYLRTISSGRIYDLNEKGERVYANEEERDKHIKKTESDIKKYCH